MDAQSLLTLTDRGLYCPAGGFHIDPWKPVPRAVVTHAHSDHARAGSERYLALDCCAGVLKRRVGADSTVDTLRPGESLHIEGVRLSLHPAGHILGSAQVRLEHRGMVAVVSGDYKTEPDPTCSPFEPLRCNLFISECTFGLPIYRWSPQEQVFAEINAWWRAARDNGRTCLLLGYSLGKAQRLLAGLDRDIGPIHTHGAVEEMTTIYRDAGVRLPPTSPIAALDRDHDFAGSLILAPPAAHDTPWARRLGELTTGLASGWMTIRGARRRRAIDRGFVLSDHADWPGLLLAIQQTGCEEVWLTHGYTASLGRYLNDQGRRARTLATQFQGEAGADASDSQPSPTTTTDGNSDA